MNLSPGRPLAPHEIGALLTEARNRTLLLLAPLEPEDLRVQHSPLMSPIVWDLGHIGHFEEVWLLEKLALAVDRDRAPAGADGAGEGLRGIYNPFENPRAGRDRLPLPSAAEATAHLARIRRAVLGRIQALDLEADDPLLRDGFVFRMVLQHEYQHGETILQTLQLKKGAPYEAPRAITLPEPGPATVPEAGSMVRFPGGRIPIGTEDRSQAYDNERGRHVREVDPFLIDVTPVTCGQYLEFMEDGGYEREALWSPGGVEWLRESGECSPAYWRRDGNAWVVRTMDREAEVDPTRPVCHVTWHEADAFARWAGKRLPTEVEWEAAATWDPKEERRRTWPWGDDPPDPGRANLDALAFDVAPVGSFPDGASPVGCHQMIGDVWEWTSSEFRPYPGFEAFPYREYSEVFFGSDFRVLRGGSWATRFGAIRPTFRNWDFPIRRQIFSGFRCVRDIG